MPYIPKEVIDEVKKIDLLTYLKKENPLDLVHIGRGQYRLRSHDSLKISDNGLWHWFSRGIGGKTALNYLIEVEGFSFMDAALRLSGSFSGHAAAPAQPKQKQDEKEKRGLSLPEKHDNNDLVFRYLTRDRSIDTETVQLFLRAGDVYESRFYDKKSGQAYTNAVFVGRDEQGAIRQASIRGIDSTYKTEAPGSDKRFSFSSAPKDESATAHIYESAIDLMSYISLLKAHGKKAYRDHHISLSGIYKPRQDAATQGMPLALGRFLETHPEVRKAVLHFDNDLAGKLAEIGRASCRERV